MDLYVSLNSIAKNLYNKIFDDCTQEEKIEVYKKHLES
jgi:hypothetical protein|tara:strand:- start:2262 stop:2375 length:114 start_codon:yes stop_codon:yes gene_type:complete